MKRPREDCSNEQLINTRTLLLRKIERGISLLPIQKKVGKFTQQEIVRRNLPNKWVEVPKWTKEMSEKEMKQQIDKIQAIFEMEMVPIDKQVKTLEDLEVEIYRRMDLGQFKTTRKDYTEPDT